MARPAFDRRGSPPAGRAPAGGRAAAIALACAGLVACGPDAAPAGPAFVYAGTSTAIHAFAVDRSTGALRPGASVPAGDDARLAEVDPRNRRVYVQTQVGTPLALLTFAVAPGTGALTRAGELPLPHPMVEGVTQLILHPTAPWLLLSATNGSPGLEDQLLPVDSGSGALGAPRIISQEFYGFAWDPSGRHFYGFDGEAIFQYAFEPTSGTITPRDPPHAEGSLGRTVLGLDSHRNGSWVYSIEENAIGLFSHAGTTGLLRAQAFQDNPVPAEPIYWTALSLHESGRFLYALGYVAGTRLALVDAFSIHPATGLLTFLERESGLGTHELTHTGLQSPLILGDLLFLGGQGATDPHRGQPLLTTYRIDPRTGTLSPLGLPTALVPVGTASGTVSFLFTLDP